MNKLKFIGAIALIATAWSAADASVVTFKVKNADKSTKVMLVLNTTQKPEPLSFDDKGVATYQFNLAQSDYADLYLGRERKMIFLDPKVDLTVSFDVNTFQNSIQFTGTTAPANNYLNSGKTNFIAYKDCTVKEGAFILKSDSIYNANLKVLNSQKGLSKDFLRLEKNRLKFASYQTLLSYPQAYQFYTKDNAYEPTAAFYNKVKSLYVSDPSLLSLSSYKSFLSAYVHTMALQNEPKDAPRSTLRDVKYADANIADATVKQYLINNLVFGHIAYEGLDGQEEAIALFHKNVKDQEMVNKFNELSAKWEVLRAGKPSPSFACQDINGKTVSLADLKGKYVYIDVWATWCGPCRGELPHLKKLEEAYGEKDIHFVSISCDQNKKAWEDMVTKQQLKGIQLIFGKEDTFSKAYMINGIPRFILLDREGNIVSANATRPSDPATAKKFDELLSSK